MADGDVIRLRCSPANVEALEKGINVTFLRFARGEDGIYEFEIQTAGGDPLPDSSDHPLVPLAEEAHDGD